jgi:hypothetical protein
MTKSYDKYRVGTATDIVQQPRGYEKYKKNDNKKELQSNKELIAKSVASGVLSNLDLPQALTTLAIDPDYGLYGLGGKAYNWARGRPQSKLPGADYINAIPPNIVSNAVKSGIKKVTGVDLTPKPSSPTQKIIAHAGEFAGGMGPFGLLGKGSKLANTAKSAATGATIGTVSGGAQALGVNPVVADISSSLSIPAALGGGRNLLNSFTREHRNLKTEQKVANALKKQIGEENVPEILENIQKYKRQKKPVNIQPTTPELAQNVGLSRLYRTQTNTPSIPARFAENDRKLKEALEKLGTTGIEESAKGEAIRNPFVQKLSNKKQRRHKLTEPLYQELEAVQGGINPTTARSLLLKELEVSSPGNKAQLERYLKNLERNQINSVDVEKIKDLRGKLKSIDKEYKDLSPKALEQLKGPITQEISALESSTLPRPIQIENTIQELGDKVNAFARTGETNAARKYGSIKKAYEEDLGKHPLGLKHRQEYKRLSKPINDIETSSLLNNFVKQNKDVNKLEGFVVPSEKIPSMILGADLNNTKILVNKSKNDKELLDLIKGVYTDKLLETSKLQSGNFSYDKAKKFLDNKYNKEKINVIFNNKERQKLHQFLDTLEKRSKLEGMGKVSGSDTHQKLKVDNEFNNSLGFLNGVVKKGAAKFSGTGQTGELILDTIGNAFNKIKNKPYDNILEDVLLNPNSFKKLMTKQYDIKGFNDFYNPIPGISTIPNSIVRGSREDNGLQ